MRALQSLYALLVWITISLAGLAVGASVFAPAHAQEKPRVVVLTIADTIGPASADYFKRGLDKAVAQNADLVILALDTPGGLDTSMRAMIHDILGAPIPVATFVSPSGARAASAGTFILYASHIAAMTPASNIGAASPVSIGIGGASGNGDDNGDDDDDEEAEDKAPKRQRDVMSSKIENDASAYLRSLAQLRDRDVEFAREAVEEAASIPASEALERGVIEWVAQDIPDLLDQLSGSTVLLDKNHEVTLALEGAVVETITPDWRTQLLALLANPQLAIVLMMIGVYGLFFELTSPGFALPGVAGLICLVLGLYAFHMLPINWAGAGLLLLGIILMIAEAFVPSFGALGIGGIIAFMLGGIFLTDTEFPAYQISWPFMAGLGIVSLLMLLITAHLATRSLRAPLASGLSTLIGLTGRVTDEKEGTFYAEIQGEHWRVVSDQTLTIGDKVTVTDAQGLTLTVKHASR